MIGPAGFMQAPNTHENRRSPIQSALIKALGDDYEQRLRERYNCTAGAASGWCDGTKRGTRMRCPELIRCKNGETACEYAL